MLSILGDARIEAIKRLSMGTCDRAAIIGTNDGSVWGSTLEFQGSEAKVIATNFRNRNFQNFRDNGIMVEGVKYDLSA